MPFKQFAVDSLCNNVDAIKRAAKQIEQCYPEVDGRLIAELETTADSITLAAFVCSKTTQSVNF